MDWWLLTFFLGAIFSLFLPIVPVLSQLFVLLILAILFLYHKKLRTSSGLLFGAFWLLLNAYSYEKQMPVDLVQKMQAKEAVIIEGRILTLGNAFNEIKREKNKATINVEKLKSLIKTEKKPKIEYLQQSTKFNFEVSKVDNLELNENIIIRLNWNKAKVSLGQGQRLRLKAKVKPAHGLSNLGGFNYKAWLRSQNIVATGYVVNDRKKSKNNVLLVNSLSIRQQLFNQYQALFADNKYGEHVLMPFMFALAFGERSELTSAQWSVLQATGTGHLIAISGLHIGLVASGGYLFIMLLVRLLPLSLADKLTTSASFTQVNSILLNSNSRYVALFFSLSIALFYGFLAGYSLPTQRALVMLGLYWLARLLAIKLSIKRWLLLTLFILVVMTPFSLFTASFWLSVYAVIFIFVTLWRFRYYLRQGHAVVQFFKGLLIIQVSLTLMLLPINALFFQQISVVAFFANIFAVPWMSFITIPWALLSVVAMPFNEFIAQLFIKISIESMSILWQYLVYLANFSFAQQALSQWLQQLFGVIAIGVFILIFVDLSLSMLRQSHSHKQNINCNFSVVYVICVLALVSFSLYLVEPTKTEQVNLTKSSEQNPNNTVVPHTPWQLHLFDVGQGLSILISHEKQALLYDTGDSYPSGFNMVDAVVLPYLQYAGIKQVDKVFLSHSDSDHAGGLTQLLSAIDITQLVTNDSQLVGNFRQWLPCYQGMSFDWKNLNISALWPIKQDISVDLVYPENRIIQVSGNHNNIGKLNHSSIPKNTKNTSKQGNDDSCVLLISDGTYNVLLTGDITEKVEQKLLLLYPELTIDVLVVPHHGSKTSSSTDFIKQLDPQIALVSAGFLNRWHMPVKKVATRYEQLGVPLINTSDKGQIVLTFTDDITVENYHDDLRPFWFNH